MMIVVLPAFKASLTSIQVRSSTNTPSWAAIGFGAVGFGAIGFGAPGWAGGWEAMAVSTARQNTVTRKKRMESPR